MSRYYDSDDPARHLTPPTRPRITAGYGIPAPQIFDILLDIEAPRPFTQRPACADAEPDTFFESRDPAAVREAKSICRSCPVRTPCLERALTREPGYGIYGGHTPTERLLIARRRDTSQNPTHPPAPIRHNVTPLH